MENAVGEPGQYRNRRFRFRGFLLPVARLSVPCHTGCGRRSPGQAAVRGSARRCCGRSRHLTHAESEGQGSAFAADAQWPVQAEAWGAGRGGHAGQSPMSGGRYPEAPGQMGLPEGGGQGSAQGGSEEAALSRALSGRVRRGLLSDRALPGGLRAPPATQRTISAVPLGRRARPRSGSGGPPGFPRQKLKGGAAHGVGTPLACGGKAPASELRVSRGPARALHMLSR